MSLLSYRCSVVFGKFESNLREYRLPFLLSLELKIR